MDEQDDDRRISPTEVSVGIAVLAYEASTTITGVLEGLEAVVERLPAMRSEVLVADDHSTDGTAKLVSGWMASAGTNLDVEIVRHDRNLGYGGNQKSVVRWATARDLDLLVVMHGDGQHDPREIPALIGPLLADDADVVLGARTLVPGAARDGGMPVHRFVGNRCLTWVQNRLASARFSEWHSGFAYRIAALDRVEADRLPDGFEFDCAMTLALLDAGVRIREVPCATRYAGEVSRVHVVPYGLRVLAMSAEHWLRRRDRLGRKGVSSSEPVG